MTYEPSVSSLYTAVPFAQDASVLVIGERTNANGSKAFREAMIAEDYQKCLDIAKDQTRDGAHLLDLCVDYVGRDGVADMTALASRLATASTLPIMLDSTETPVLRAGLEHLGGRCAINSVNYEDGDGPESRFHKTMELVAEHGAAVVALTIDEEGQARTAEKKVEIAERLINDITGNWGVDESSILIDCLTFTIATGQEESRKDGIETIEAIRELKKRHPDVQTTLGLSNISFGLNPAARQVLNSVFLHECQEAGLDSAIVHASKILPMNRIPEEQRKVALDLVYDRRREGYDPLQELMRLFEGVSAASSKESRAAELAKLPLFERLAQRIVDGERNGLEADLDEAMTEKPPLGIINENLLAGMKTVGELFGSGQMQLPFVLQSAEVMKTAVAYLEPHMEKSDDDSGKGRIVLATVKGDVHDIGKNLVDIILSNNGYEVVNIGIKQPIANILEVAEDKSADVVGMSGLLVKSTVVMKENLEEMNTRGVAEKFPVLLGGAALTRSYVENDLADTVRGRSALRARRFRGSEADGHHHERQAGRGHGAGEPAGLGGRSGAREGSRAQGPPRAVQAHRGTAQGGRGAGRGARTLRCRGRCRGPRSAVLGVAHRQGAGGRRLHRAARRARIVPGTVGITRCARRRGTGVRGFGGDRGPAAAAVLAGPVVHRRHPGARRRGVRLLPGGVRGRRRRRARRAQTRCRRSGTGSPSRASSAAGSCASPTSSGRGTWPPSGARLTCCRSSW